MPLNITCDTASQVPVTCAPKAASGKPAPVDGPIKVTVLSGSGTVVQDAADPLTFKARSGDTPDTTEYLVEADADLGEGVVTISDTVTAVFTSETAVAIGLVAGPAEPKV